MWKFRTWWRKRQAREWDIDEEIRAHLRMEIEERVEAGETPEDAERSARRAFGSRAAIVEQTREVWRAAWVDDLERDVRHAMRSMWRNPGYAVTAMLCLGLGIGVNTTVFTWLDEMYYRRLPLREAGDLTTITRGGGPAMTWRRYMEMKDGLRALAGVAAVIPKRTFLDVASVNDQIHAEVVSANYFGVLKLPMQLGRAFDAREDMPEAEAVAVLSDRAWRRHFHGEPRAVGSIVHLEDQAYRVIGIAPAEFRGTSAPLAVDAWVPVATYPHYRAELRARADAPGPPVFGMGRLAPGMDLDAARAELHMVDARSAVGLGKTARSQPLTARAATGYTWAESQRGMKPVAMLLAAVAGIVLLIASSNVANLLLARAAARRKEMAIRRAVGAGRGRLFRQTLTEGFVLALGGAVVGLALGYGVTRALGAVLPGLHPALSQHLVYLDLNWRVAVFTAGVSLVCALLFSFAPALENLRADMGPALKGAEGPRPRARWTQRDVIVVAQVGLSLVLLVSATLLIRALLEAEGQDPGFATHHRMYIRLFAPDNDFTPEQATRLFSRLLEEARALPGVREATLSLGVFGFMDGGCAAATANGETRRLKINVIEPNYFQFQEVAVLAGRAFGMGDRTGAPQVMVVNETMARQWWPGENPIGKTVWLGCGEVSQRRRAEVVGMVRDSKYGTLDEEAMPFSFLPWRQVWWNGFFALQVHTAGAPEPLADALLRLARTGGQNLRIYETETFERLIGLSLVEAKARAALLLLFSALAVGLATVGLYGVIAYLVTQRTREFGLRMALGATAGAIGRHVLGRSLRLTGTGIVLGCVLSAVTMPLLRRFLFGVSPHDWTVFAIAGLGWAAVTVVASIVPLRRATRVDPAEALRLD